MNKFIKLIIIFFSIILLSGCGGVNKEGVINKTYKKINNSKGYKLDANMKLINNEDTYNYDVSVSYKKYDNYRVSIRNTINNYEQIILKNNDGVYVLNPSLNKSFKFQSSWPYNNSQSYILQSIIDDIKNDKNSTFKKENKKYIIKSSVNYKNNANIKYQKVFIDSNFLIKKVIVYDKNDNENIIVNFKQTDLNAKFDKKYFTLKENISLTNEDTFMQNTLDEPIYPMFLPTNTYLESEKTIKTNKSDRIILTFKGEKPFMLVEEPVSKEDKMIVVPTSGDIDMFNDTLAVIKDDSINWLSNGISYYLVSSKMNKLELLDVAKSISQLPLTK